MGRNYFRVEKFLLKLCGVSVTGIESTAYKIYSFFLFSFSVSYPIIASGDLFKHDFNDNARVFVYIVSSSLGIAMILALSLNRVKLGKLLNKLEEAPFLPNEERGGNKEHNLIENWLTFQNRQRIVLYTIATVSMTLGMAYTVVQRVRYNDHRKWIFNYGPLTVLNVTYSPNYEISMLYQNISMVIAATYVCLFTITLSGILSFASVQFQLLQNYLRNIVKYSYRRALQSTNTCDTHGTSAPGNNIHSNATPPWIYLQGALKEAVSYHLKIFELISEVEEIYSLALLVTYIDILGILCFLMYITTSMLSLHDISTYKVIGEGASAIILSLLMCYWGEQVAHESEIVGLAAYESTLVGTDPRFQKALVMIIRRSQKPLKIKAGNFIETTLVTFAWILRASYSYFMVLRNINQQ